MESPRMYDTHIDDKLMTVSETSVTREINNGGAYLLSEDSVSDLSDLNTAEISLDLQGLIDDPQFPDGVFFPELLEKGTTGSTRVENLHINGLGNGQVPRTLSNGMPPASNATSLRQQSLPSYIHHNVAAYHHEQSRHGGSIKQEPMDGSGNYNHCTPVANNGNLGVNLAHQNAGHNNFNPGYSHLGGGGHHGSQDQNSLKIPHHSKSSSSKHKKNVDKGTDEYRKRRERNNIAVRKSREKAKQRTRETEVKVKDLLRENDKLQKRVDQLSRDLQVMRNVVSQVGGNLPDTIQRELTRNYCAQ